MSEGWVVGKDHPLDDFGERLAVHQQVRHSSKFKDPLAYSFVLDTTSLKQLTKPAFLQSQWGMKQQKNNHIACKI